jgi:hypothetical protein
VDRNTASRLVALFTVAVLLVVSAVVIAVPAAASSSCYAECTHPLTGKHYKRYCTVPLGGWCAMTYHQCISYYSEDEGGGMADCKIFQATNCVLYYCN